jgi:tetratricopeptide (TPR) repeat protein
VKRFVRAFAALFALITVAAHAQTADPNGPDATAAPAPAASTASAPAPDDATNDPAKIAEFQRRFAQGQALEKAGKFTEALAVFDGIIADAPDAKGSLREAGLISMNLGDLTRANGYFEKLHLLVPDYPMAIESLIQINQALKRDVKVAMLNRQFHELYAAGKVPNDYFIREHIGLNQGGYVLMCEYFDYTKDPNTIWRAEVFDATGNLNRRLLLNYDPEGTTALRAKDPRLAQAEVFNLYEHILKDGRVSEIDVYKNYIGLPDYEKTRKDMLAVIANPPKPIYSAAVPAQ